MGFFVAEHINGGAWCDPVGVRVLLSDNFAINIRPLQGLFT